MYYSPICFEKYADINLFPKNYPNNNFIDLTNINVQELNKLKYVIILSIHDPTILNKSLPYIKELTVPFVIITCASDGAFPDDHSAKESNVHWFGDKGQIIEKLKSNVYFKHWFTVNKTTPNNDKFTSIPYGLDFWAKRTQPYFGEGPENIYLQNKTLTDIVSKSIHFSKRIPVSFCNFHFNFTDDRYHGDRRELCKILSNKVAYFQKSKLPRTQSWIEMSKYSFVISPFGHGMDCIRTMEALCLGCIVIMKKSCLDCIYEGLPILLVDEWEDITEKLLKETLITYSNKEFNLNKLTFEYWNDLVLSKF
jgi:hypothetical protein